MSEIQRFDFEPNCNAVQSWGTPKMVRSVEGYYVRYTDLLWYKRGWFRQIVLNATLIVTCAVLAAFLVHGKAARGPVSVPMGAGEKLNLFSDMEGMWKAKEKAERQRDDLIKLNQNYNAQIKALNAKADNHVAQLEALQARGQEIDRLNKEQAQRMSTHQGVVLEAKRVLGVEHVSIIDRQ